MKRIAPMAVAMLFRQLAGAQRGGLPLADAFAILARDTDLSRAQAALIADLAAQVSGGRPLSAALENHRATFAPEAIELVRAADGAGALADALELLAGDYEQQALQRAAVRGALAWPATVAVVLALLLMMVVIFVVPAFKEVFAAFGADLPGMTLLLLGAADAIASYWYMVVIVVVVGWFLLRGRKVPLVDPWLLRLPFLRGYLVKTFVARASRTIGAAAQSRLPLAPALAYLRATTGNRRLAAIAGALEAEVQAGKDLANAVRGSALPGQLAVALELGERSKNLGPALRQLVAFSEGDAAKSLMRLQQAALVTTYVGMGCIVAFVVIALYLPIFVLGAAV